MAILRAKAEGPRLLGADPDSGKNVYVINGRFGDLRAARRDAGEGRRQKAR